MPKSKVKPCPKCGSRDIVRQRKSGAKPIKYTGRLGCWKCGFIWKPDKRKKNGS